jgi:hypothetical protein
MWRHLRAGADLNARDKKGMTALGYAMQQQQPAVISVLRDRGAEKFVSLAILHPSLAPQSLFLLSFSFRFLPEMPPRLCVCFLFCFLQCYHEFFVIFDCAVAAVCGGVAVMTVVHWRQNKRRGKNSK